MLYLANASSPTVRDAMRAGELGMLATPNEGRKPLDGVAWAADNSCFGPNYVGDTRWRLWLERHANEARRALFAVAPDVVGDAAATLARSAPHLPFIRSLGYPAALAAQDGLEQLAVPWHAIDALFLGGSTRWKLSPHAHTLARTARELGKHVHMGRVNSGRRWVIADVRFGCHTADGTFLAKAPDKNLARFRRWPVAADLARAKAAAQLDIFDVA